MNGMRIEIVIFAVVILHFLLGFGWLAYKLLVEKDTTPNSTQ